MTTQKPVAQIPPKPAYTRYACVAGIPELDGARCQDEAVNNLRCEAHQDSERYLPAARPTRVLVKMNLPGALVTNELRSICEKARRSVSQYAAGKIRVIAEAEQAGRDPSKYQTTSRRVPDSGSEVFCGDGAVNIMPAYILEELLESFGIKSLKMWEKEGRSENFVLQLEFCHKNEGEEEKIPDELVPEILQALLSFTTRTWKAYIYCNIPKKDGTVLHTVNLTSPNPSLPRGELHFAEGDWEVKPNS